MKIPFKMMDAFARPMEGLRSKTVLGGTITVTALLFAVALFVSQLYLYIQPETLQSIRLAPSYPLSIILPSGVVSRDGVRAIHAQGSSWLDRNRANLDDHQVALQRNQLHVHVHITFPYIPCDDLHFAHDGAVTSGNNAFAKIHGRNAIILRTPTAKEYLLARTGHIFDALDPDMEHPSSEAPSLGCTVEGNFQTMRIGGEMSLSLTPQAWDKAVRNIRAQVALNPQLTWSNIGLLYNMTHYIHQVNFGRHFVHAAHHPLKDRCELIHYPSGIAVIYHNVKIIPTLSGTHHMYQLSTASHVIQPETLEASNSQTLPGIVMHYDLSPLEVHHVQSRENFLVFMSSLISIVGGVYITVSWLSGLLVDSAKAIAKKRD